MSHKWVRKWKSESWIGGGNYTVSVSVDGYWGCSCPNWKFRRATLPDGECKHIKEIKAMENWKEGDVGAAMKLTALRVEKLKTKGKTEKQIEKDLSKVFSQMMLEFERGEAA